MQMKLELVAVPVTDVDRAKTFYVEKVGFNADHDHSVRPGDGVTDMAPGTQHGLQMVVADAKAAGDELRGRGVDASEVDVQQWGSFVTFADPDGNTWALQGPPPGQSWDHKFAS
jgi:catechol 2,3-dioxygenase-like lactoylglutathione lyase family enzyme